MEMIRKFLVFFLVGIFLLLGTGVGVVHICSAYCVAQDCSYGQISDICNDSESCRCGNHSGYNSSDNDISVSEDCSCINIKYEVSFISKISQTKVIQFVPVLIDLPDFLIAEINRPEQEIMSAKVSNAPPGLGNRVLLALHSVLII